MHREIKKVVWFNTGLIQSGGGERLSLESVRGFKKQGIEACYVVFYYDQQAVFDGLYHDSDIIFKYIGKPPKREGYKLRVENLLWLRRKLLEIRPDVVITQGTWGQVTEVFLATLFSGISYAVHIYGSIFAFPPSHERSKYALVFRKHFHEIRNSLEGYRGVVPDTIPAFGLGGRFKIEVTAFLKYLAVRKAKRIFVLSRRNQWEVEKLYGREAVVLKGAFPLGIFGYFPKINVKNRLGIEGKRMVLSVCRLVVNKRVDLSIRAFAELSERMDDLVLVLCGTGPEEGNLRKLVKELGIESKVMFVGYVREDELWDYNCACDVFVSLDLADFDIAPLEALALGRKVVLTDEMELDEILRGTKYVYSSEPVAAKVAVNIESAITSHVDASNDADLKRRLFPYSWEQYSASMICDM